MQQLILHLLQLLGGAAGSNMAFEDKLQVTTGTNECHRMYQLSTS